MAGSIVEIVGREASGSEYKADFIEYNYTNGDITFARDSIASLNDYLDTNSGGVGVMLGVYYFIVLCLEVASYTLTLLKQYKKINVVDSFFFRFQL